MKSGCNDARQRPHVEKSNFRWIAEDTGTPRKAQHHNHDSFYTESAGVPHQSHRDRASRGGVHLAGGVWPENAAQHDLPQMPQNRSALVKTNGFEFWPFSRDGVVRNRQRAIRCAVCYSDRIITDALLLSARLSVDCGDRATQRAVGALRGS